MGETKGEPAVKGKVYVCPNCGLKFTEPLDAGPRNECADEPVGCGKAYRVIYVD